MSIELVTPLAFDVARILKSLGELVKEFLLRLLMCSRGRQSLPPFRAERNPVRNGLASAVRGSG